jgi:hypothetical protein
MTDRPIPGRCRRFRPGAGAAGVSGLGLVRALLPRRTATLTLQQLGDEVHARHAWRCVTVPSV